MSKKSSFTKIYNTLFLDIIIFLINSLISFQKVTIVYFHKVHSEVNSIAMIIVGAILKKYLFF